MTVLTDVILLIVELERLSKAVSLLQHTPPGGEILLVNRDLL